MLGLPPASVPDPVRGQQDFSSEPGQLDLALPAGLYIWVC